MIELLRISMSFVIGVIGLIVMIIVDSFQDLSIYWYLIPIAFICFAVNETLDFIGTSLCKETKAFIKFIYDYIKKRIE